MKLARKFVCVVVIASACALTACSNSRGACCDACGRGQPCTCNSACCDACAQGLPCTCP